MDPTQPVQNVQPVEPQHHLHSTNWLMLILIAVVSLALAGGAIYFAIQKQTPEVQVTKIKPTPTKDVTANWKTYTNTIYNFSVKYPDQLTLDDTNYAASTEYSLKDTFTVVLTYGKLHKINQNTVIIRIFKREASIFDVVTTYFGLPIDDWKNITIGNIVGKIGDVLQGGRKMGKVAYVTRGNYIYYFHISRFPDDNSISESIFDQILSTFKFTQ